MISVVIPHANSFESLKALLLSLQNQICDLPFEVIAVANPLDKYEAYPELHLNYPLIWQRSKAGANAARQQGVSVARGSLLVFLDDDCEISNPYFLQTHAKKHEDASLMGVGGRYQLINRSTLCGRIYNKLQNDWLQSHRLPQGLNMHLLGGNTSYKKAVFSEESFDEKIIFGGTETEFQIRLHQKKFRLKLFEDLTIDHDGYLGFLDFLRKAFKQGMGACYIKHLHQRPPKFVFANLPETEKRWIYQITEWLYKVSFDEGQAYYQETQQLKVSSNIIYKRILKAIPRKIFSKEFKVWREGRVLSQVIANDLLSSKHSNEKDCPPSQDEQ